MATALDALATALAQHRAGRLDLAEPIYRRILLAEPGHAGVLHLLGMAAYQRGQIAPALEYFRAALAAAPQDPAIHNNLGLALQAAGQGAAAGASYRRALGLAPRFAGARYNLGRLLHQQGLLAEAAACYQQALAIEPDCAPAYNNLGNLHQQQGRLDDAVLAYRRALHCRPDDAEARNNLGAALKEQGKLAEAAAACAAALAQRPQYAEAAYNLANVLHAQGFAEEALAAYEQAIRLKPFVAAHSSYLVCRQYQTGVTPADLAAAHAAWDERHGASWRATWPAQANDRDPGRRLRLGFVSPDLGRHPVATFFLPTLTALGSHECETICYSDRVAADDMTARCRSAAGQWRDVAGWSDARLGAQICADRVDILFDLAGHFGGNRLLCFARKPAPIQIGWINYPGTTGLVAMDYVLADPIVIPPGEEPHYRERVLRLPENFMCYTAPADAPPVGPLPARERGAVTFGSLNNLAKASSPVLAAWAAIVRRVPGSRLLLKSKALHDEGTRQRWIERLAAHGIEPERLEVLGWTPYAERLDVYGRIDIALDSFPYSGSTTTCESLWMGVPVLTCLGPTFAGRQSASHLIHAGVTETVASDLSAYVELAVAWAGDWDRLAALRAGLRARMAASPLCDGSRHAAHLMTLLRAVWRDYCAREGERDHGV